MSSLDEFALLPEYLQRRIDKAFEENVVEPTGSDLGGGFIVQGSSEDNSQIPLSAIPTALQRLDLPPDDARVLTVFKNAASGWKKKDGNESEQDSGALYVSRDDWRSVLAVLLEPHGDEYEDSDGPGDQPNDDGDNNDDESGEEEVDEYEEPSEAGGSESDSDADEYTEEGPSSSRRTRAQTTRARRRAQSTSSTTSSLASISTPKKLTSRQKKTCLDTYALFFPSASDSELPDQRVTIKDIQRLTKLIGDSLKANEIIEMLEEFSTSPDKSMSFEDFGNMMLAARLA